MILSTEQSTGSNLKCSVPGTHPHRNLGSHIVRYGTRLLLEIYPFWLETAFHAATLLVNIVAGEPSLLCVVAVTLQTTPCLTRAVDNTQQSTKAEHFVCFDICMRGLPLSQDYQRVLQP